MNLDIRYGGLYMTYDKLRQNVIDGKYRIDIPNFEDTFGSTLPDSYQFNSHLSDEYNSYMVQCHNEYVNSRIKEILNRYNELEDQFLSDCIDMIQFEMLSHNQVRLSLDQCYDIYDEAYYHSISREHEDIVNECMNIIYKYEPCNIES